jgi:hypothetical protein
MSAFPRMAEVDRAWIGWALQWLGIGWASLWCVREATPSVVE